MCPDSLRLLFGTQAGGPLSTVWDPHSLSLHLRLDPWVASGPGVLGGTWGPRASLSLALSSMRPLLACRGLDTHFPEGSMDCGASCPVSPLRLRVQVVRTWTLASPCCPSRPRSPARAPGSVALGSCLVCPRLPVSLCKYLMKVTIKHKGALFLQESELVAQARCSWRGSWAALCVRDRARAPHGRPAVQWGLSRHSDLGRTPEPRPRQGCRGARAPRRLTVTVTSRACRGPMPRPCPVARVAAVTLAAQVQAWAQ